MTSTLENNVERAIALLKENIETVPPHGCKRDEVLALLEADPREEPCDACGKQLFRASENPLSHLLECRNQDCEMFESPIYGKYAVNDQQAGESRRDRCNCQRFNEPCDVCLSPAQPTGAALESVRKIVADLDSGNVYHGFSASSDAMHDIREALRSTPAATDGGALGRVVKRMENCIARYSGDWSLDHRLAYIFAVVSEGGWGEEALAEMSKQSNMTPEWITAMREDAGVIAALTTEQAEPEVIFHDLERAERVFGQAEPTEAAVHNPSNPSCLLNDEESGYHDGVKCDCQPASEPAASEDE